MKKIKKLATLSMICFSLFSANITAFASVGNLPDENVTANVKTTAPACPRCGSSKFVVAHGLVAWCCLNCNYCFM